MRLSSFVLLGTLASSVAAGAGVLIGNGGDLLTCRSAAEPKGLYSLDYLLTRNAAPVDLASVSLEHVSKQLWRSFPQLALSLDHFRALLFSSDLREARRWVPEPEGLVDVQDEALVSRIPNECLTGNGVPLVHQAIVRERRPASVVYHFDPHLIERLSAHPMQLSFLLVHEWLWDHVSNASINRDVNGFLHSSELSRQAPHEVELTLANLGLELNRDRPEVLASANVVVAPRESEGHCSFWPSSQTFDAGGADALQLRIINRALIPIVVEGVQTLEPGGEWMIRVPRGNHIRIGSGSAECRFEEPFVSALKFIHVR